jgi:hypothetical protein
MAAQLPRGDDSARQIRRALADWRNLGAIGRQHATLTSLVQELLSRKVGASHSLLDEYRDEITDPASLPDVVALAARLRDARARRVEVWIPPMGGADIAIKGMLVEFGIKAVRGELQPDGSTELLRPDDVPSVGLPLGVFKAAQLIEMDAASTAFMDFTAVDLETTDRNTATAEIVEIAAVRVRGGRVVERYSSLVKPDGPVSAGATAVHGIGAAELAGAPR